MSFKLFSSKERPDAVAEDTSPTLSYFFKQLWRKAGKLLSLNLMMVCLYLPLVAVLLIYFLGNTVTTAESPLFAPLLGVLTLDGSPAAGTLLGLFSKQLNVPSPTPASMSVMAVLLLFTFLTWGWQNVGATYNLRSLVRGDSCFLWSDYFYAIRRNWRQGLLFGLLDALVIAVLLFDWYYFSALSAELTFGVMYLMTLALAVIYTFMRFYIYLMMITFDLSIMKLLKNALIFALLGFKRNILALGGILLVVGLNFAILWPSLGVGFSLPLILPFFYLPAFAGFAGAYAAYPNIERYMIGNN